MIYLTRPAFITAFLFLTIMFFSCAPVDGTHYYVSNDGNDRANGTSPVSAWQSISRVNSHTFKGGDSVFFRCGDTWRETLKISNSGKPNNHITYTAYGNGSRPKILGSIQAKDWEPAKAPNVWVSGTFIEKRPMNYDHNGTIFFEFADTTKQGYFMRDYTDDLSNVNEEFSWTWKDNKVYIYCPEDPDNHYKSVEVAQQNGIITLGNGTTSQYITIDGLNLRYAQEMCIYAGYPTQDLHGLEIRNCELAYTGRIESSSAYGLFTCFSDLIVENCLIHDHGRRGISFTSYKGKGLTFSNIHIRNNHFYNGYHTTSIDCQILEGGGITDTLDGFYFYNNYISNDTSQPVQKPYGSTANDIFFQGNYMNNIYVYNNVVKGSKARAVLFNGGDTVYIVHNTFFGMNPDAKPWAQIGIGVNELYFVNNICYNDLPRKTFAGFNLMSEHPHTKYIKRDYNLYYQKDPGQRYIYDRIVGAVGGDGMSWHRYMSMNKFDQNSPTPQNPLFIGNYENLRLQENSPAKNAGMPVSWINTDVIGNQRDKNSPSIGAYE